MQYCSVVLVAWLVALFGLPNRECLAWQEPSSALPSNAERDRFLLDDIASPKRTAPAPTPASTPDFSSPSSAAEPSGQSTNDRNRVGSDLGEPSSGSSGPDSFFRELSELMRTAQRQLRAGNSTVDTQQIQQRVVEQLDQLIAAQENQQQQPSSAEQGRRSATESEETSEGEASAVEGEEPGGEATGAEGNSGEQATAGRDRASSRPGRSDDDVWGHLPERMRQQLQNAAGERFLPKYEDLIEAFYRRLAEDDSPLTPRMTP